MLYTPTSLKILEALWRNQNYGDKRGRTSDQLASELKLSVVSINTSLRHLQQGSRLITPCGMVSTDGRPATAYTIDEERIITWPVSAILVLRLFQCDLACCSQEGLQDYMLSKALVDPDTNRPYEQSQINNAIAFAEAKGYIAKLSYNPDKFGLTLVARDQWPYLNMIKEITEKPS